MDERTRKAISDAKAVITLGQHWVVRDDSKRSGGSVWPTDILVIATRDFSMGGIVTLGLKPHKLLGLHFPIRADVLLSNYKLVHDPFNPEATATTSGMDDWTN